MKKIVIIHNLPIDYYPPSVNLINTIKEKFETYILTTKSQIGSRILKKDKKIKIKYLFKEVRNGISIFNLIRQLWFVFSSLLQLIKIKPNIILYYETISSAPVYLYLKYFNRNVKVYVHYHEYYTKEQFLRTGMRLWKKYKTFEENYLLKKCKGISQTNVNRLNFFKKDFPFLSNKQCYVLPNYPPRNWKIKNKTLFKTNKIKCVYVGSLSLKDLYLSEFINWINKYEGLISVDFYSFNFHKEVINFFKEVNKPWIKLYKDGINYYDIPNILKNYDVGLLLYKANTINYQYNETNKLYEYLSCGLNIWYSSTLILVDNFAKQETWKSRFLRFDFKNNNLPKISKIEEININNNKYKYYCENIYGNFLND